MISSIKSALTWLRSAYSEDTGQGSSTRLVISALVGFVIVCGISLAILVHEKRVTVAEFNSFLGAASGFLVTSTTPLYASNKLAAYGRDKNANGQQPPTQQ
jgi:hypothetical protein